MNIEGLISRFTYRNGGVVTARFTDTGSLAVEQVKPPYAELARAGLRHGAVVGNGATFKAPITAYPTATATWALYNRNPDGGASYVIDTVFAFLASGTAGIGASLIAGIPGLKQGTALTAFASTVVANSNGSADRSNAVLANNVTLAATPVWEVLDTPGSTVASATIGQGLVSKVEGRLVVPPGFAMGIDVLSGVGTTALYGVGVTFHVLQLDRE